MSTSLLPHWAAGVGRLSRLETLRRDAGLRQASFANGEKRVGYCDRTPSGRLFLIHDLSSMEVLRYLGAFERIFENIELGQSL